MRVVLGLIGRYAMVDQDVLAILRVGLEIWFHVKKRIAYLSILQEEAAMDV
jgi:hypothetical protein